MPVLCTETHGGRAIEVQASGKLSAEDYREFVPQITRLITQHGKVSVLFEMRDFHGWSAGALWEDLKFDVRHFRDIDRLALVGERKWESLMGAFCRPFTTAKIKYFDLSQCDAARAWVAEHLESAEATTVKA